MGRGKNRFNSQWLLRAFCINASDFCFDYAEPHYVKNPIRDEILTVAKEQLQAGKWFERIRFEFYPSLQITFDKGTVNIRFVERNEQNTFNPRDYNTSWHQGVVEMLLREFEFEGPENSWIGRKNYRVFGKDSVSIVNGISEELRNIAEALKAMEAVN